MSARSNRFLTALLIVLAMLDSAIAESPTSPLLEQNDAHFAAVVGHAAEFAPVISIDHARLAAEAGVVTMPPSRVAIFKNTLVNSRLMAVDPVLGLELPYRVLAFVDGDTALTTYADRSFLESRHAVEDGQLLDQYDRDLAATVAGIEPAARLPLTGEKIEKHYGIINLPSDLDFKTTLARVESAIRAQEDTVWFGEIDYQQDARQLDIDLNPATLLLFGGPAPGGLAMSQFPRLGLDAFCQKILVLEDDNGRVTLYFNDIVALAELYYNASNKPQAVINQRLHATLSEAVRLK